MCLRYSSSVVAPTQRSSPRASIGLSRLAASTAPWAAPAPTTVCSSSMNRITVPCASATSLSTLLRRSSNSPLYAAPAITAPMSSAITRRSRSDSGTSVDTMRCASPSTIAVLPTPGSPISTGLFFVRRESTWITRRISSSRPITGSSLPSAAAAVRPRPKRSSGLCCCSSCGGACAIGLPPLGAIFASPRPQEGRAHVCEAHQLAAAVGNRELRAEGAAHLLQLLSEVHLRVQRLELERFDARVHALDVPLQVQHALHAGEVQPQLRGHLLDAPELVHVVLGVQARALGRAPRLDQAARLVHAQRLRVHVRQLRRHRDHEHAAVGRHPHARDRGVAHGGPAPAVTPRLAAAPGGCALALGSARRRAHRASPSLAP